ncbi:hypothetical protein APB26_31505 [Pseudomonas aeruginosa]|nr:hypothetical protein APB26_31505 [Pseudomonas aeruginosa]
MRGLLPPLGVVALRNLEVPTMQLAMLLEETHEGPIPIVQARAKRAYRRTVLPKVERQLSLLDILTLPESELGPVEEWTDDEIADLRLYVLHLSTHVLLDLRASAKSRKESLEWIFSDAEGPFSFKTCVAAEGGDWIKFREELIQLCAYRNMPIEVPVL